MATIESEVILFNLNELSVTYKHQLSLSSFSDFSINLENHQVVLADESGAIPYFDGDSGRVKFLLKGGNLDKIFDIDIVKNRIITGGKDRSVSIYNLESGVVDKYSTDFYIYAVALDENAERALLILDEDNHVGLFDIKAGKITAILQGDGKSLGFLKFISDHQALGATYNQIFLWSFR
jgi:WD40 repeat protein